MKIAIVNCFDTYEHRVNLLYDVFSDAGHGVTVLSSNYRHFEKVKRTEQKADYIFFDAMPYQKNFSYRRLHSHQKLSRDIFHYLEKQDEVDLLWVLVPPNSFVKDAGEYKRKHSNVKLIFDLIDLWPESMTIGSVKNLFPFSIWKNLRDRYITRAECIVTECKLYQEKLRSVIQGVKTENLYLARELVPYEPHLNLSEDRINLCYLGSINNIIDIDAVVAIITEFQKRKPVELHVVGDGERKEELLSSAERTGAKVVFHGKVYDREEKQRIFDSCHYGLNIMKDSVCVGLTMKSMDYMEFGLPMINNIHGDTWEIIEKKKIGYNVGSINIESYDHDFRIRCREYFEANLTKEPFKYRIKRIIEEIE